MRKLLGVLALIGTVVGLWTTAVVTQTVQCGGSFVPSMNCVVSGRWNFSSLDSVSGLPYPFQVAGVTASGVVSRTTNLTNGQILAINTTPITVVPAPGGGKYVDVIGVFLYFDYTGAYTGGSALRLWYTNRGTGPAASAEILATFLTTGASDAGVRVQGTPDNTTDLDGALNAPVVLQAAGAAFGSGNASNTLRVVVNYRIVTATGTVN